jgi:hypothetical protein
VHDIDRVITLLDSYSYLRPYALVAKLFLIDFRSTYDHRVWKTGLPVRSAVLKPHAGRLVVGWVTTSESLLLYVFFLLCSIYLY